MTLPMDDETAARPVARPDPSIADLARGANGLGEAEDADRQAATEFPMAGVVTAGFWSMAALSLAGMSVAANTAARVWSLGAGRQDGEDV